MKKLLITLIILVSLNALGQKTSSWFVSVAGGPSFGGPMPSLRNQIESQNFNQMSQSEFFGVQWSTQYPKISKDGSIMMRVGMKISDYKSVYVSGGISNGGEVRGFKGDGTYSSFWLFGGTGGDYVDIDYEVLQFSAGYQYSFAKTRTKVSVGPAAYILRYAISSTYSEKLNQSAVVPGISTSLRVPLGKEKKLVGFDLMIQADLAPPAKMKNTGESTSFQAGKVNMAHGSIGLALSFRR
jgi:hypothetical protein